MPFSGGPTGGSGGFTVVAYTQYTADVNITATLEASADTIVTAGAFAADGTSAYLVCYFAPYMITSNVVARNVTAVLYEDGSSIGKMGQIQTPAGAVELAPVFLTRRLIPAGGSRTYSIRGIVNGGTGVAGGGAGGVGNFEPGFVMVQKLA